MGFFKNKLRGLAVWSTCMLMAACQTDVWVEQERGLALKEGEIALQWLPANMGIHRVTTRGTDPKTALEQEIKNVHVFIFTAEGEYLAARGSDAFQGYRYMEGNQNLVLNSELFDSQPEAANACVYVLANFPKDAFGKIGNDGRPANVADRDALEAMTFELPEFTATLPETGLPMVLRRDNVNLSTDATEKIILLQLRSMMARIDLNFTMEPDQYNEGSLNPSLRINEVRVGNFPKGGTIVPQLESMATDEVTDGELIESPEKVENWEGLNQPIRRNGNEVSLTLYMFEHSRQAKALSEIFIGGNYPDNITDAEKQRYKNALAKEDAAYIELVGDYTNHNGYTYTNVTYRLYPGANPNDDFTIKSNCQYKNNITITGITVNNEGNEALLDTRVNIDRSENPYFIEMLRERKHDAHFNVTPMDVFLYEVGSKVKVEILEPESHRWIRMEPYKTAVKNKDSGKYLWVNAGAATCDYAAKGAGDGKREYFTTDLFAGLNTEGELGKQENSTSYTVTWDANDTEQDGDGHTIHEERIYFYIDENVPQDAGDGYSNLDASGNVMDRSATVRITYTSSSGATEVREAEIEQYGMLRVSFDKFETDGPYDQGRDGYEFYIEYYEEYLEHYDGKNTYNETYDGLEWGFDGIRTGLASSTWYEYLDCGWRNTMSIMQQFRNQLSNNEPKDLNLNMRPRGAAEYCYNKNKRDSDGKVQEVHWYLPAISELEYALEKWYGTFDVFQEQWYWSSNPGCSYNDTGEDSNYARASQVRYDPTDPEAIEQKSDFVHAQSSANEPYTGYYDKNNEWRIGGHALRDKVFRIRAAYIHDVEKDRHHKVEEGQWPWGEDEPDDAPPSIDNSNNLHY